MISAKHIRSNSTSSRKAASKPRRARLSRGEHNVVVAQMNRDVRAIYTVDLAQRTQDARQEGRKELFYSTGALKVIVDSKLHSQAAPQERTAHSDTSLIHARGKRRNNGIYRQDAIIQAFSYLAHKDERSLNQRAEREAKRAERASRRQASAFLQGEYSLR